MIRPSSLNNKSILENLYRILRMSLLLGDTENKDETVANFEDTAIKLDNIEQEEYNKNLDSKFYTTVTLEEEERKLSDLIKYVSERVESRKKIEDEYEEAIGRPLGGLEPIAEAENINNYQVRLDYIKEYLDNSKKIESTEKDIEELKNQLEKEEEIKKEYEKLNDQMENQLIDKFNDIIHSFEDDYYQNLDATNIDSDIATLDTTIEENKKSLDIFTKSYETLRIAGISTQDEIEYSKYVKEAKEVYYKNVEQRYLLKLYKLVFDSVTDFESIFQKRTQINSLLEERLDIRKELNIETRDSLLPLYSMLDEQYKEVETEKENIDNISSINEKIKFKQAKLENLHADNQKVEILELLKEFCIIDTYELPTEEPTEEVTLEKEVEQLKPNTIVEVKDIPASMNLDIVTTKTNTVMKRVGEMLGIKEKEVKKEEKIEEPPVETTKEEPTLKEATPVIPDITPIFPTTNEVVEPQIETPPVPPTTTEVSSNAYDIFPNEIFPPVTPKVQPIVELEPEVGNTSNILSDENIDKMFWPEDTSDLMEDDKKELNKGLPNIPNDFTINKDQPGTNIEMPSLPGNE